MARTYLTCKTFPRDLIEIFANENNPMRTPINLYPPRKACGLAADAEATRFAEPDPAICSLAGVGLRRWRQRTEQKK
jgi:hypothetical protein